MKYKIKYRDEIIAAFVEASDRDECLDHLEDYWGAKMYPVDDDE